MDLVPARGDPVGVDVLRARHRRDGVCETCALVVGTVDLHALAPLLDIRHRTKSRGERSADVAQESKRGIERRVELDGAEIEQPVAGAARERGGNAGARRGAQAIGGSLIIGVRDRVDEDRAGRKDCDTEY